MTTRLTQIANVSMVGKSKTPQSLAERMPSPCLAAKVGMQWDMTQQTRRVVRRSAR